MKWMRRLPGGVAMLLAATMMQQANGQEAVQSKDPLAILSEKTHKTNDGDGAVGAPVFTRPPMNETAFLTPTRTSLPVVAKPPLFRVATEDFHVVIDGISTTGILSAPQGIAPSAAVLAITGLEGLGSATRSQIELYAQRGAMVLAVDLYDGSEPGNRREAGLRLRKIDPVKTMKRLAGARDWLAGKSKHGVLDVAVVGYGLGGQWAMKLASEKPAPLALGLFYGGVTTDRATLAKIQCPVLGFFSKRDAYLTPDRVALFDDALTTAGVQHNVYSYEVEPGFAIEGTSANATNYREVSVDRFIEMVESRARSVAERGKAMPAKTDSATTQPMTR